MPVQRKTKTPESVPNPGDPERKRVLNVLAQRRYRQRRREKIAALEAQAQSITSPESLVQPRYEVLGFSTSDSSRSSSERTPEEIGDEEEVRREPGDIGFPILDMDQEPMDFSLFQDFDLSLLPSPIPTTSSSPTTPQTRFPTQAQSFPFTLDGALLGIPHLTALRAFSTIAHTLDLVQHIFDPTYTHVLTVPSTQFSSLPPNLHPTQAQLTIPHHPLLDTLPWPSVREKLICMFSLPSAMRPPVAREDSGNGQEKAVVKLLQDIDDYKDGVRVHGCSVNWGDGNELVEESWEVGEVFFRNWWWCMDSNVIDIANRRRRERGQEALRLQT